MGGSMQRKGRLYGEMSKAQTGKNVTCIDHSALPLDPDITQLYSLKAGLYCHQSCHFNTHSCHFNTHPLSLGGRCYDCAHLGWRKLRHELLSNLFKVPQRPMVGQVDSGHLASESLLSRASASTGEPDTWKVSKLRETINGTSLNKSREGITSVIQAINNYELLSTECWAFPMFIKETL